MPAKRSVAQQKQREESVVRKQINKRIVGEASQRAVSQNEGLVKAQGEAKLPEANDPARKKKHGAPFARTSKKSKSKGQ